MSEPANTDRPGPLSGRGLAFAALTVTALAGGGAAWLASGPDAPQQDPVAQVQLSEEEGLAAIAADAPIQELGVGEVGDWRRGVQTRFVVGDTDLAPAITLQAGDFQPGRYHFDGEVTISGEFTQPYVEITADTLVFEQGISADHVRLISPESDEVWRDPDLYTHRRSEGNTTFFNGFTAHVPRGDISIGGDVIGDDIEMTAGRIDIAGDALGTISLAASQGENRDILIRRQFRMPHYAVTDEEYLIPRDERTRPLPLELFRNQEIPEEHMREVVRWAAMPAATSVTVAGTIGEDVTIQTPRDVQKAAERAALQDRIAARPPGPPAVGSPAAEEGAADRVDTPRRRPIP